MADNKKKDDYRTFLSLGEVGKQLETYQETDPRFKNRSEAARHLIPLGIKADRAKREKALADAGVK